METKWRQHGDQKETKWRQNGGKNADKMETKWRAEDKSRQGWGPGQQKCILGKKVAKSDGVLLQNKLLEQN